MCTNYFNNAFACAPLEVNPHCSVVHRNEQIYDVIKEIFPAFLESPTNLDGQQHHILPIENLIVKPLEGGLSNHLFLVAKGVPQSALNSTIQPRYQSESYVPNKTYEISGSGYNTLLVRVYPDSEYKIDTNDSTDEPTEVPVDESTDDTPSLVLVDRNVENKISAWLASANEAPVYFGKFCNGRLEEYYEGCRTLTYVEMGQPKFARAIGIAMARLHRIYVPDGILACDIEKSKESGGEIWDQIDTWLEVVQSLKYDRKLCDAVDIVKSISEQRDWLKSELHSISPQKAGNKNIDDVSVEQLAEQFCREVVFTHMDCQSLNILTPKEGDDCAQEIIQPSCSLKSLDNEGQTKAKNPTATIHLIDFEYAALNRRAVDLANTFCEHCDMTNLAADYDNQYPSKEQQNLFLRAYINGLDHNIERTLDQRGSKGETATAVWSDFLDAVRVEIGKHALLSHLAWSTWAIAQIPLSRIEFDYLTYAKLRMEGYEIFKRRYWPNMKQDSKD